MATVNFDEEQVERKYGIGFAVKNDISEGSRLVNARVQWSFHVLIML